MLRSVCRVVVKVTKPDSNKMAEQLLDGRKHHSCQSQEPSRSWPTN
jgi:hypothetical protein